MTLTNELYQQQVQPQGQGTATDSGINPPLSLEGNGLAIPSSSLHSLPIAHERIGSDGLDQPAASPISPISSGSETNDPFHNQPYEQQHHPISSPVDITGRQPHVSSGGIANARPAPINSSPLARHTFVESNNSLPTIASGKEREGRDGSRDVSAHADPVPAAASTTNGMRQGDSKPELQRQTSTGAFHKLGKKLGGLGLFHHHDHPSHKTEQAHQNHGGQGLDTKHAQSGDVPKPVSRQLSFGNGNHGPPVVQQLQHYSRQSSYSLQRQASITDTQLPSSVSSGKMFHFANDQSSISGSPRGSAAPTPGNLSPAQAESPNPSALRVDTQNLQSSQSSAALYRNGNFSPKPPKRASSTFNFFSKKDRQTPSQTPVSSMPPQDMNMLQRAASYSSVGSNQGTHPDQTLLHLQQPPSTYENDDNKLTKTLSKSSLAGGGGWGMIVGQLPKFNSLYSYSESEHSHFTLLKKNKKGQVGEGAGGLVRTAKLKVGRSCAYSHDKSGGDLGLFAVKTFRKQSASEGEGWYCAKLVREFKIHSQLSHNNIVRLLDLCVEEHRMGDNSFVAVMEYCVGGDLFDIHYVPWGSIQRPVMHGAEKQCCFKQLMHAVNYMHAKGIAHRDIKLENLLVNGHGTVKLADFGTSVFVSGSEAEVCKGEVGTDHSMPPEAFMNGLYDGLKADIWACACVYHFLTYDDSTPKGISTPYPFGMDGAYPENKLYHAYLNKLKRYYPEKHLTLPAAMHSPGTPAHGGGLYRQDSIGLASEASYDDSDEISIIESTNGETGGGDDLRSPLRKCNPFTRMPASSFTAMRGMLDPNADTRWSAHEVLATKWFRQIDCCVHDTFTGNPNNQRERPVSGTSATVAAGGSAGGSKKVKAPTKVHHHIKVDARKAVEASSVEQQRNQSAANEMRSHK